MAARRSRCRSTGTTSTARRSAAARAIGFDRACRASSIRSRGRRRARARDRDEIEAVRRAEQRLELRAARAGGRYEKMPPPSLSTTTNVAGAVGAEQPVGVVQEAQVAAQRDGRRRRASRATPTTVDTNPSMPLAPRLASTREPGARRHAPLERAHRQARRDDERRAVGERGRDVARDRALERRVRARRARGRSRRGRARSAASQPSSHGRRRPARPSASATAREQRVGVGGDALARRRGAGRARRRRDRRAPAGPTGRATRSRPCSSAARRCAARGRAGARRRTLGTRSSASYVEIACGPVRRCEIGSASTGQPAAAAKRVAVVGRRRPRPAATSRPRGCARTSAASRATSAARGARRRGASRVHGAPSARPGASTSGAPVGTQRLAERQVEVHRARRAARALSATARLASARHAAPALGSSAGGPGSQNQRTAPP